MRITLVVDSVTGTLSGIGRYTWELCQRLPHEPSIDQLGFYTGGRFIEDVGRLARGVPLAQRKILPKWLNRRTRSRRLRSSLVHGPNYFLPEEVDSGIITVHDLSVFRFPETHPVERVLSFERNFDRSLRQAIHVITDTQTVRNEIIQEIGVRPSDITAIKLGVGPEFRLRALEEIEPHLAGIGLPPGGYGLCVSTLEPRKKIAELLRAWSRLPRTVRNFTPLVLAGGEGWLNEALHAQIARGVEDGWLVHLGYVAESDLPALYAGAALFVYPSIYEGFGLPPVEAMACGVPTLVSNRSCLPEVCGDAAGYVDPDDTDGFTAALAEALEDARWREEARRRGIGQAAKLSWSRCASETAAVYAQHWRR